jgi:hypothetical protein
MTPRTGGRERRRFVVEIVGTGGRVGDQPPS